MGFVLDALRLGLIDHRLVRPRIDYGEHVAFVDLLAFDEVHALQLAVDLRADGDGIDGLHRTQSVEVDGHVARRGFHHGDRDRRGLGSLRLPSAGVFPSGGMLSNTSVPPSARAAMPMIHATGDRRGLRLLAGSWAASSSAAGGSSRVSDEL